MTQTGKFRIRLKLDPFTFTAQPCILQVEAPKLWRGVPVDIEVGIYHNGSFVTDITNYVSINMEIHPLVNRAGATLVSQQILLVSMTSITEANWLNGSAQHAKFQLTSAETNFDLTTSTDEKLTFWMVFWADIGSSAYPTLGYTKLTVEEDAANLSLAVLGSSNPNFRVTSGMLCQIHNPDTSKYHSIWITGAAGQETLMIGPGET